MTMRSCRRRAPDYGTTATPENMLAGQLSVARSDELSARTTRSRGIGIGPPLESERNKVWEPVRFSGVRASRLRPQATGQPPPSRGANAPGGTVAPDSTETPVQPAVASSTHSTHRIRARLRSSK